MQRDLVSERLLRLERRVRHESICQRLRDQRRELQRVCAGPILRSGRLLVQRLVVREWLLRCDGEVRYGE